MFFVIQFLANLIAPMRLRCDDCERWVIPTRWDTCPRCCGHMSHLMVNRNGRRVPKSRVVAHEARSLPVMALRLVSVVVVCIGVGILLGLAAESLGLPGPSIADVVQTVARR